MTHRKYIAPQEWDRQVATKQVAGRDPRFGHTHTGNDADREAAQEDVRNGLCPAGPFPDWAVHQDKDESQDA